MQLRAGRPWERSPKLGLLLLKQQTAYGKPVRYLRTIIFLQRIRGLLLWVSLRRPSLWSSSQSSWVRIHRSGFVPALPVGLERGPLSLVSTTEERLGRKSSGSGMEIREYGRRDPSRWSCGIFYPQKLALTSPTSGGHSVGIVRLRTKATEFRISLDLANFLSAFQYSVFPKQTNERIRYRQRLRCPCA
jgi:hypothetical protein